MPAKRAARKHSAQTSHYPLMVACTYHSPSVAAPASHDSSTATVRSLGPLADQDECLRGHTKTAAREINNARLREAVKRVAPKSPECVKEHKPNHKLVKPRLCYGLTNPHNTENVGKWYQKVRSSILASAKH
jgi:hypothetical protein